MSSSPGYKSLNGGGKSDSTTTPCCCTKSWRKCPCYGKACIVLAAIIFVFVVVVFMSAAVFSVFYPLHASCRITWSVNASCYDFQTKLNQQISVWKGDTMCNNTQRCLYLLKGNKAGVQTKATHTTPKARYIDDLTFDFSSSTAGGSSSCQVKGYSTSETWYAVLDKGTNYCNLNNLITGSGIDKLSGFTETTSDSVCTQYSQRNCDIY